ncbi:hypothetical protein XENOCAPTIV_016360 [Xenoophorus captivus]|uniref:Uncharacterized protein n=1 Tax=Xenoophorus captivus TaxID=1517983 RepID=A0ABV0S7B0_9TELE
MKLSFARLALSFAHVCFLCCFLDAVCAQEAAESDAPRRRLTWQHNGQVFSILSRGAMYRPSVRTQTGSPRRSNPVLVLSSPNDTAADTASRRAPRVPAASSSAQLRAMARQQARPAPPQAAGEADSAPVTREDMMVGDDPYNPYKRHGYDPYYNYFDTYYRPRPRAQARPGYGTQYHQNGFIGSLFLQLSLPISSNPKETQMFLFILYMAAENLLM